MLTISLTQTPRMKCIRNAIFMIAACALFHWARAQNGTENTVLAAPAATALAQPANQDQERARLVQDKARVDVDYEAAKADCYQKFQVNSCLADARTVRINRSTELKRQEVLLNDAQRKRRAAEQLQRTQEKALARGEDAAPAQIGEPSVTPSVSSSSAASPTLSSQALLVQAQRQQRTEQKAADQQTAAQAAQARKNEVAGKQANAASKASARKTKQAKAAQAKARYEANLKEAEQRRANALARQQAAKKNVAPLPVPAN
jgi:colicin import membrane protein